MRRACYLLALALVFGACGGGDSKSDTRDLERNLTQTVEETTGTRDVVVDCPDGAEGDDLCDVTAKGGLRAKVTADGEIVQP